jgi:GAF domain
VKASAAAMQRPTYADLHRKLAAALKESEDRARQLAESLQRERAAAGENVQLRRERNEALEHQTATSEVLSIISRSPTDVQPVLDAIVESAARVCGIDDVALRLREGNSIVSAAHIGPIPVGGVRSIDDPQTHWIREHGTLHVPDIKAQQDFPTMGSTTGSRTFLLVPLSQRGELIGTLVPPYRSEPLSSGANQTARDLRRSGRHRDRKRAAVQRA